MIDKRPSWFLLGGSLSGRYLVVSGARYGMWKYSGHSVLHSSQLAEEAQDSRTMIKLYKVLKEYPRLAILG